MRARGRKHPALQLVRGRALRARCLPWPLGTRPPRGTKPQARTSALGPPGRESFLPPTARTPQSTLILYCLLLHLLSACYSDLFCSEISSTRVQILLTFRKLHRTLFFIFSWLPPFPLSASRPTFPPRRLSFPRSEYFDQRHDP